MFGADGAELDYLREIIPPWAKLGSRMATLPEPPFSTGRYSPWGRLAEFRRNFDRTVFALIDKAKADPRLEERTDILALLLRSTYDDGTPMSRQDVSDELLTLLGAGHETTASTLGWAFERLRRHPDVLAKLVEENDEGGNEFRQATILELQRNRTVIDFAGRHVQAPHFDLGEWRIPHGYTVMIAIANCMPTPTCSPIPSGSTRTDSSAPGRRRAWVPFGGGTRRCIGAAFANVEMDVVLRTVLRHFVIETDDAPDEKIHFRGHRLHAQGRRPHRGAPPRERLRLDFRALRQLPARPREVAGVAVRVALQVVLVLRLGLPEVARGRHLGDDLARPQARGVDVGDGVQRDALLLVVECRRSPTGSWCRRRCPGGSSSSDRGSGRRTPAASRKSVCAGRRRSRSPRRGPGGCGRSACAFSPPV